MLTVILMLGAGYAVGRFIVEPIVKRLVEKYHG